MGSSNWFQFQTDDAQAAEIERYAEQECDENTSEAIRQLTREGLQQKTSPLTRWRSEVRMAVTHLLLVAIAITVIGTGTPAIQSVFAMQVAAMLLAIAASVLTVVELARRSSDPLPAATDGDHA
jgi:hypothetical protein